MFQAQCTDSAVELAWLILVSHYQLGGDFSERIGRFLIHFPINGFLRLARFPLLMVVRFWSGIQGGFGSRFLLGRAATVYFFPSKESRSYACSEGFFAHRLR